MSDSSASFVSSIDLVHHPLIAALAVSCFLHFLLLQYDPSSFSENRLLGFLVVLPTTDRLQTQPVSENVTTKGALPTDKTLSENSNQPAAEASSPQRIIYPRNELDIQPRALGEINLEPPEGYSDAVAGKATLSLLVGESGRVQWVGVSQTDLDSTVIEHVVAGFMNARFSPAQKNGKAVPTLIHVEVEITTP